MYFKAEHLAWFLQVYVGIYSINSWKEQTLVRIRSFSQELENMHLLDSYCSEGDLKY
jgi:hypothetical protein